MSIYYIYFNIRIKVARSVNPCCRGAETMQAFCTGNCSAPDWVMNPSPCRCPGVQRIIGVAKTQGGLSKYVHTNSGDDWRDCIGA